MALEDLTGAGKFITALNPAWPVDDDWVDEGDNHIRGIKNVLRNTFPDTNVAVSWSSQQARFPDGILAVPGIAWVNEPATGLYRVNPGQMRVAVGGAFLTQWDASQFYSVVAVNVAKGTAFSSNNTAGTRTALVAVEGNDNVVVGQNTWASIIFRCGGGDRGVFTTSGGFKAIAGGSVVFSNDTHELSGSVASGSHMVNIQNAAASGGGGVFIRLPNNAGNASDRYIMAVNSGGANFEVRSNSGVVNYQSNNVNLSDASVKRDIAPGPDYTGFVEGLQYKRFDMQGVEGAVDGLIAQDVKGLAPELVTGAFEDKLGVYEQRLQQRINSVVPRLIARVRALEAKLGMLSGADD